MGDLNLLLVVWDACRLDAARDHAPHLKKLAQDNLWFENAIAPAGQSLGSHVSMFTGEYPHEHGIYEQTDIIESTLPLVGKLGGQGYDRHAVSANGFAAPKYGFDRGFDTFYNTQGLTVYPEGLDVHGYARRVREQNEGDFDIGNIDYGDLLRETLRHDRPLLSVANVAGAALSELVGRYPWLQKVPHRRFNKYNEFSYDPEDNTKHVTQLFKEAAVRDEPFFLFTNYMDPHHPYAPPEKYQKEYCGRTFSYRKLSRIAEMSHPFGFLERVYGDDGIGVSEAELETIRDLYAGEVRTVDEHLGRLLDALEKNGLREETLVVVTADHGENLGRTNRMGERHMGHIRSASEAHLRVPLVIAHPDIEERTVEEYVSTKNLYRLFTSGRERFLASGGRDIDTLVSNDGVTISEVPRTTATALSEKYPSLTEILQRHLCAAYGDEWKAVGSSNRIRRTWHKDSERPVESAPSRLWDAVDEVIEQLMTRQGNEREISDAEQNQLEALGYL